MYPDGDTDCYRNLLIYSWKFHANPFGSFLREV